MEKTGMNSEFASILYALGWEDFVPVTELGSLPLTIQFLCSLVEDANDIKFCLFVTEYRVSWKDLSRHLGFSSRCVLSLSKACCGFSRDAFWGEISGQVVSGKFAPRCNDIQNLTLRLLHKWLAIALFLQVAHAH